MTHNYGVVEVICGSMFSGKTEEMIRRLRRATIAKQEVMVFKPDVDRRYGNNGIYSHCGTDFPAIEVKDSQDILTALRDPKSDAYLEVDVVAIDEAQFFDPGIVEVIDTLAVQKIRVIVAGLDTNFRGEPFNSMPEIIVRADIVDKLQAICTVCGGLGTRTQRILNGKPANYNDPLVVIGASDTYEARCRIHHEVPGKKKIIRK